MLKVLSCTKTLILRLQNHYRQLRAIFFFWPFHLERNVTISLVLALKRQVEGRPLSWSCNQCDKILTGSEIWVDHVTV